MCVLIGDACLRPFFGLTDKRPVKSNCQPLHSWSHCMLRQSSLICTAGIILAFAACDQSTGPSAGISQADANQLAADFDAISTPRFSGTSVSVVAGGGATVAAVPTNFTNNFDVTAPCPKGGQLQLAGTLTGT